ncbi:SPOSA6832_02254, partial [Sporobolomyces salmonicolor]
MPYETPRENLDVVLPPRPFLAPYGATAVSKSFTPTSPLQPAFNVGLTGAGVGLFVSAIKNSLDNHNKGAMGIFTRSGWLIGYFASIGFAFTFVDHTVANLIETKDNGVAGAAGGCAAGFVAGIRTGSIPKAMGMCAFLGAAVGTYDLAGGQLGWESGRKTRSEREKERMDFFKKREEVEA